MLTFDDLLAKYRSEAFHKSDQGTRFERLMRGFLLTEPVYRDTFKRVWLWSDFFAKGEFGGHDIGIDIVAETYTGQYWAIQCKCFRETDRIDKGHLDSFLSASSTNFNAPDESTTTFSHRLWIDTTIHPWSETANTIIQKQTIKLNRIALSELRAAQIDWGKLEKGIHGDAARPAPKEPRDYQLEAIKMAHKYFISNDRGKMIMACGTGKTFTALRITEQECGSGGFALVLVPSNSPCESNTQGVDRERPEPNQFNLRMLRPGRVQKEIKKRFK